LTALLTAEVAFCFWVSTEACRQLLAAIHQQGWEI
jgi:hypothetical protein